MEAISLHPKSKNIVTETIVYLQAPITGFDLDLLQIETSDVVDFEYFYTYSFDNQNWSAKLTKEAFEVIIANSDVAFQQPVYIGIWFCPISVYSPMNPAAHSPNVSTTINQITLNSIIYDAVVLKLDDKAVVRLKTMYQVINEFPKWNFYDNQQVTVSRWLAQCNALAESHGHTFIYFKTEAVAEEINHTLQNNNIRNVVSIKKLKINIPGNALPQDVAVLSEWDRGLEEDFIVHIVTDKFEQAFGRNNIPLQSDYVFFPLMNKLFRVNYSKPRNGFMGKVGWWEVYLGKFEDDECVGFSQQLKDSLAMAPDDDIENAAEALAEAQNADLKATVEQMDIFKYSTTYSAEKIAEDTIEEKKLATENYTNKLEDSNNYISLKESDQVREFIEKRMDIVSVNPGDALFPITMYNCQAIERRTVAMTYNLEDFTIKNKKPTTYQKKMFASFNYVLVKRFSGELLEFLDGTTSVFTVEQNRKNLSIIKHLMPQETITIDFEFIEKEFYTVEIEYSRVLNQLAVRIFELQNKQKTLKFQNIYMLMGEVLTTSANLTKIYLYGGSFLMNDLTLKLDNNQILNDIVNPILQMNKFSLK